MADAPPGGRRPRRSVAHGINYADTTPCPQRSNKGRYGNATGSKKLQWWEPDDDEVPLRSLPRTALRASCLLYPPFSMPSLRAPRPLCPPLGALTVPSVPCPSWHSRSFRFPV